MIALSTPGCATLDMDNADTAQLADTATTGAGIAAGLQEANPVMAPLANAGPIGLLAMAGIKLGFNQLGRHQEPETCREWLSISAAAGWGAATSNLAMLMAPPLALVALPIAIQSYRTTYNNTALEDCYEGMLADAILRVPQDTHLDDMPEHLKEAMLEIVGVWPEPEIMNGTRLINNRKLIQIVTIDRLQNLQRFISEYDLDWTIIGLKEREGNNILPLNTAQLIPHLQDFSQAEPNKEHVAQHGVNVDASTGTIAICNRGSCIWTIETEIRVASTLMADE
ncbi:MAG: hypothetical protein GY807_10125 [Gammaproteobacteria bacterium]|nr:hypothetical protein [Gammaproteobacteria bacterium]